ncbi:MAG: hypothetical protein M3082_14105 [Candidatus Dormibacteraeota bacterium]|nr:hypothetical protein [Candidatus Dormibacteraeota bacterium]
MQKTVSVSLPEVSTFRDRIIRPLTRVLNPHIMRVAGGRWFPIYAALQHRGHRSGHVYATPITAVPRGGFFWLGLAFGEDSGWARNVLAAGECVVRYRATAYQLVDPVVLDGASVRSELPQVMRIGMSLLGFDKVLRMRPMTNNG